MQFTYKNVNKYINFKGIISKKVWVIAAEAIKIAACKPSMKGMERSRIATLFVWNPGIKPVITPIKKPRNEKDTKDMTSFNMFPLNIKFHFMTVVF